MSASHLRMSVDNRRFKRQSRTALYAAAMAGLTSVGIAHAGLVLQGTTYVNLNATSLAAQADGSAVVTWTNAGDASIGNFGQSDPTRQAVYNSSIGGVGAVTFSGTQYMVNTVLGGAPADITGNGSYSMEVWAYNPAIANEECMVNFANRGGPAGTAAQLGYGGSADFGAIGHWDDVDMGYPGGAPTAGLWHHIVDTFDGVAERLYVDGALVSVEAKTLNMRMGDQFYLGMSRNQNGNMEYGFSGSLAQVRVHGDTLSAAGVVNNFQNDAATFGASYAGDNHWIGTATADWSESTQWSLGSAPSNNVASIGNGGTVTLTTYAAPIASLLVNGGSTIEHSAGALNPTYVQLGHDGTSATYNLGAGTLTTLAGGNISIGFIDASGTLTQNAGSAVACGRDIILGEGGALSSGVYNMNDGTMTARDVRIGQEGAGVFTQVGGTATPTGWTRLGIKAGASGAFNMQGGSYTTGDFNVGEAGAGTVTIDGGNILAHGGMLLARNGGGSGGVTQNGGAFRVEGYASIGASGSGQYTVNNGDLSVNGDFNVSDNAGTTGTLTLKAGTVSSATGWGATYVGKSIGTVGNVDMQGGAFNAIGAFYIGRNAGSDGTFAISGGTLAANTADRRNWGGNGDLQRNTFRIGDGGTGTLLISGNTIITNNYGAVLLGEQATGQGVVVQTGNSTFAHTGAWVSIGASGTGTYTLGDGTDSPVWTMPGDFNISDRAGSKGTLIMNSGSVTAGWTYIGKSQNCLGTMVLKNNASFTSTGEVRVGNYGVTDATNTGAVGYLEVGGTASFSAAGWFNVGQGEDAQGTLLFTGHSTTRLNTAGGDTNFGGWSRAKGFVTINENATVTANGYTTVSRTDDTTGTLTVQDNGTLAVNSDLAIGEAVRANGTLNLAGNGYVKANNLFVARWDNAQGAINMTGGTLLATNATIGRGVNASTSSNGIVTQSDGTFTATGAMLLGEGPLASGTYALSGGILSAASIAKGAGAASFPWTGGTLKVGAYDVSMGNLVQNGATSHLSVQDQNTTIGGAYIQNSGQSTIAAGKTLTAAGITVGDGTLAPTMNFAGSIVSPTLTVNSGTVTATSDLTTAVALNLQGGTYSTSVDQNLLAPVISPSATLLITDSNAKLNITDSTAPGPISPATLTNIWSLVRSGYNGTTGAWSGTGITTTAVTNSSLNGLGLVLTGDPTLEAQTLTVREMILGDVNGDNKVTIGDVMVALNSANYQQDGTWLNGDVNYDGKVTIGDVMLMLNSTRYQQDYNPANAPGQIAALEAAGLGSLASAAVPEPATLGLLAVGAMGFLARRRRA